MRFNPATFLSPISPLNAMGIAMRVGSWLIGQMITRYSISSYLWLLSLSIFFWEGACLYTSNQIPSVLEHYLHPFCLSLSFFSSNFFIHPSVIVHVTKYILNWYKMPTALTPVTVCQSLRCGLWFCLWLSLVKDFPVVLFVPRTKKTHLTL